MIIDVHAHFAFRDLYPQYFLRGIKDNVKAVLSETGETLTNLGLVDRVVEKHLDDRDCSRLIAEMDRAGISKAVLLVTDLGYGKDHGMMTIEEIITMHAEIVNRNPGRFIAFSGIDPRRGKDGLDLFEKSVTLHKFRGFKMYPPCGYEVNDSRLFPYYELCSKYSLPVLTHTGPSLSDMKSNVDYYHGILEVSKLFKKVAFIVGHATLLGTDTSLALATRRDNVFLEVSGFQRHIGDEANVRRQIRELVDSVPDKVMFGTDWPMFNMCASQGVWVKFFERQGYLSNRELEKFFYRNAESILGA
jgi:predicted TIM-barrel fold metal-dependent hydrolase